MSLTIEKPGITETWLPAFRAEHVAADVMKREMRKACDALARKPTLANNVRFDAFVKAFCCVERERDQTVREIVRRGALLLCI